MTERFKRFPSISQFSGIVKNVRDYAKFNNIEVPSKVTFSGSCKLHGSFGSVCFNPENEIWYQSRERILSYESDNAGFYVMCEAQKDVWKQIYQHINDTLNIDHDYCYINGEFCCSNIQSTVALNKIKEKKFGIFGICFTKIENKLITRTIDGIVQEPALEEIVVPIEVDAVQFHEYINDLLSNVFVIDYIVPPVLIDIDFREPHAVQNKLLELALEVENECPVGKYFGVIGVGEGIVFSTKEVNIGRFKVKGEKYQSTKVKELRELTEAEITSKANVGEFVEYACTVIG